MPLSKTSRESHFIDSRGLGLPNGTLRDMYELLAGVLHVSTTRSSATPQNIALRNSAAGELISLYRGGRQSAKFPASGASVNFQSKNVRNPPNPSPKVRTRSTHLPATIRDLECNVLAATLTPDTLT